MNSELQTRLLNHPGDRIKAYTIIVPEPFAKASGEDLHVLFGEAWDQLRELPFVEMEALDRYLDSEIQHYQQEIERIDAEVARQTEEMRQAGLVPWSDSEREARRRAVGAQSIYRFKQGVLHTVRQRKALRGSVEAFADFLGSFAPETRALLFKRESGGDELPEIAKKLQEHLAGSGVGPEDEEGIRTLFGDTKTNFRKWVGEQSERHGTGSAVSTGLRILKEAGVLVTDKNRRQGKGLVEEVQGVLTYSIST